MFIANRTLITYGFKTKNIYIDIGLMSHKEIWTKNIIMILCIPESFNKNISDDSFTTK